MLIAALRARRTARLEENKRLTRHAAYLILAGADEVQRAHWLASSEAARYSWAGWVAGPASETRQVRRANLVLSWLREGALAPNDAPRAPGGG